MKYRQAENRLEFRSVKSVHHSMSQPKDGDKVIIITLARQKSLQQVFDVEK